MNINILTEEEMIVLLKVIEFYQAKATGSYKKMSLVSETLDGIKDKLDVNLVH